MRCLPGPTRSTRRSTPMPTPISTRRAPRRSGPRRHMSRGRRDRSKVCRWPSRTRNVSPANAPPTGPSHLPTMSRQCRTRRSNASKRRGRSFTPARRRPSSACRPPAPRACGGPRETRSTRISARAGHRADRRRRWRPGWCRWRRAPISVGRSAFRPAPAGSSATSRRMAATPMARRRTSTATIIAAC